MTQILCECFYQANVWPERQAPPSGKIKSTHFEWAPYRLMSSVDIIIVDDDVFLAMDMEELLVENGYQVADPAYSGEEALEMARKYHPALVLMDIKLGKGIDGIQAAMTLREELDIPCIFVTGHGNQRLLNRAKQCRPLGYILKPLNEKQFLTDIEMAFFEIQARNGETDPLNKNFPHKLPPEYDCLTPAEIRVAYRIRQGKTSKEVAEILSVSEKTIQWHRKNIRKKLKLTNTDVNLTTSLLS